jgi:hypothetical protein
MQTRTLVTRFPSGGNGPTIEVDADTLLDN